MRPFTEICIYEVKPNKEAEFETLIQEVTKHNKSNIGVIDANVLSGHIDKWILIRLRMENLQLG